MKRVVIESPYSGDVDANIAYLRACMHDSLVNHEEAPYLSHGLYTQPGVLRDEDKSERTLGINAGFAWGEVAQKVVFYTDLGMSDGMKVGMEKARLNNIPTEERKLGNDWFSFNQATGSWGPIALWSDIYASTTLYCFKNKLVISDTLHLPSEVPYAVRSLGQQNMMEAINAYWEGEASDDISKITLAIGKLFLAAMRMLILYGVPARWVFARLYESIPTKKLLSLQAIRELLEQYSGRRLV